MAPSTPAETECPICTDALCEPLLLGCGHAFCRLCLLRSTRLAPDGRSCPLCREAVTIRDPAGHPVDAPLEAAVKTSIGADAYDLRAQARNKELLSFLEEALKVLPVFAMYPGTSVGAPVRARARRASGAHGARARRGRHRAHATTRARARRWAQVMLHFFEPRYKILIRRAWEGNRLFVFTASVPRPGVEGIVVRVDGARFLPDGRANIYGEGVEAVQLGETWVEEGTGGLHCTRTSGSVSAHASSELRARPLRVASRGSSFTSRPGAGVGDGSRPAPRSHCSIM